MIYRNISLPIFSRIDRKISENLGDIIKEENLFFRNVAILTGNYGEKLVDKYEWENQFLKTYVFNVRRYTTLSQLRTDVISQKVELILAVGGGSIIDIGKYISVETSIPLISIPTLLSTDSIASPISIIKHNGKYISIGTTPPIGVIADIDIIKESPAIYLLSGLGDLVSNISAVLDWNLAYKEIGEKVDFFAKNISFNSAINIVFNNAKGKYQNIKDELFIRDLFEGLVMSAIAMIFARTSRPASGAEHNISHSMDKIGFGLPHGIQVGFATLFTLFLHNEYDIIDDLLKLYKQFKFPLSFNELKINEENFIDALKLAPSIRERYTILNKYSLDSLVMEFKKFKKEYLRQI